MGTSGPADGSAEDENYSRIKTGVAGGASGQSHLSAVRAVTRVLRCIKSGVKIRPVLSPLRSRSLKSYCHSEKNRGHTPESNL